MIVSNMVPDALGEIAQNGLALGLGDFRSDNVKVFTNYHPEWQELYAKNGWFRKDPVVASALTGSEVRDWSTLNSNQNPVMAAAREFGLHDGLVASSEIGGNKCIAGLSFDKPLSRSARRQVQASVNKIHRDHLVERALELTPAQKDLVYLFANGFRAKQAADIFEVSEEAIKQRKLGIQGKLGVNNFMVVVNICAMAGITFHRIS